MNPVAHFLLLYVSFWTVSSQCQSDYGCDSYSNAGCADKTQYCSSNINCIGYQGCYDTSGTNDNSLTSYGASIYCGGYESCFSNYLIETTITTNDSNTNDHSIICECTNSCKDVTYLHSYSDIYCRGYYSCSTINEIKSIAGNIWCVGENSCENSNIITLSSNIYCKGNYACHSSYINSNSDILCTAEQSCAYSPSIISENSYIECNGYQSCYYSTLIKSTNGHIICYGDSACSYVDNIETTYNSNSIFCGGYHSCSYVQSLISSSLNIHCEAEYACYHSTMIATNNIYCDAQYSCGSTTITISAADSILYCNGEDSCKYAILSSINGIIYCKAQDSCYGATMENLLGDTLYCYGFRSCHSSVISIDSSSSSSNNAYHIYGYGHRGVAYATISLDLATSSQSVYLHGHNTGSFRGTTVTDSGLGDLYLYGYGFKSFASIDVTKTASSSSGNTYIYAYGERSFEVSSLSLTGSTVEIIARGYQSIYNSELHINSAASISISAIGTHSIENSLFDILSTTAIADFYISGYNAGYGAVIKCGVSSTCNIYCLGNGCNGLTLECDGGTCSVSCDESNNINCPNGNHSIILTTTSTTTITTQTPIITTSPPTGSPTESPTDTPTVDDDSDTAIECYDYQECKNITSPSLLLGTIVDCSGYDACSYNNEIMSTSGNIICGASSSCQYVTTLNSSASVYCNSASSCSYVTNINTINSGIIECGGRYSCFRVANLKSHLSILCLSFGACSYNSEISSGTSVSCSGFSSCQFTSSIIANIYIHCEGAYSCLWVTSMYADRGINCRGSFSCYGATMITPQFIYCYSISACYYSTMTITSSDTNVVGGLECHSRESCKFAEIVSDSSSIYCQGVNSCEEMNVEIVNSGGNVYCHGISSCLSMKLNTFGGDVIEGSGKYSMENINMTIVEGSNNLVVNGYGYYSGYQSNFVNNGNASMEFYGSAESAFESGVISVRNSLTLYGYGINAFRDADISMIGSTGVNYIEGYGFECFEDSIVTLSGTSTSIMLDGAHVTKNAVFTIDSSSYTTVYAYGYYSGAYGIFNVTSTNGYFYFYGYNAGIGATIICGESSMCYIYCLGNGCEGLTLECDGTCDVSCDESNNINCPIGISSNNNNENVICDETQECINSTSLSGTSVECSATRSCKNVGAITAISGSVTCSGDESCSNVGDMSASSASVICASTKSCESVTITDAINIYGYGYKSLENANIDLSTFTNTISIYLYGYDSGNGANIICGNSATCNIYCNGNACENAVLTCNGVCNVNCDDANELNCL